MADEATRLQSDLDELAELIPAQERICAFLRRYSYHYIASSAEQALSILGTLDHITRKKLRESERKDEAR